MLGLGGGGSREPRWEPKAALGVQEEPLALSMCRSWAFLHRPDGHSHPREGRGGSCPVLPLRLAASFIFPALGLVPSLSKQTFRLPAACWRSPLSQPRACSGSVGSWRQHGLATAAGPGVVGEPVLKGELVLVSFVSVAGG